MKVEEVEFFSQKVFLGTQFLEEPFDKTERNKWLVFDKTERNMP